MTDSRPPRASDPLVQPDGKVTTLDARGEIDGLRRSLRALPDIEPDPELWERIQEQAAARPKGMGQRLPLAVAASLLLAVTAGILGANLLQGPPADSAAIRALKERSMKLEPFTRNIHADPVTAAFQYRIADVDSQLAGVTDGRLSQAETQRLWGRRVALMESLAEVRRARAALQAAVY